MNELDKKLNDIFSGYVVRKDLVKLVRGNAAVPSYVLEYLLGQNCATDDEEQIDAGGSHSQRHQAIRIYARHRQGVGGAQREARRL